MCQWKGKGKLLRYLLSAQKENVSIMHNLQKTVFEVKLLKKFELIYLHFMQIGLK